MKKEPQISWTDGKTRVVLPGEGFLGSACVEVKSTDRMGTTIWVETKRPEQIGWALTAMASELVALKGGDE